jgi:glycosyltransferase involved in cell wall biosynthesis
VRAALGIPDGVLLFGFVGRLTHQKAPERLIAAFERLAERAPHARLLMIGDGEMREALRRQIDAGLHAGRIHFTNDFTGPQAMAAMDALVVPSRYEAMSYAMLEAAAAGKPLILSDVGGASTVLKDGENGLLVANDDDPAPLAEAMLAFSRPGRLAPYAEAALARSRDYDLTRMIGETEALYRSLLA